jgi:hypothetical protein
MKARRRLTNSVILKILQYRLRSLHWQKDLQNQLICFIHPENYLLLTLSREFLYSSCATGQIHYGNMQWARESIH